MYKKTTVYIEEEDLKKLTKMAMQRSENSPNIVFPSALIRIAIREFLERYWRS